MPPPDSPSERLRELPDDERPRERLLAHGPATLSNAELLAVFIRTGTRGRNAVRLARELLEKMEGLHGLARCGVRELGRAIKGIGPAKACEIAAALELGRRLARGPGPRVALRDPQAIYDLMGPELQALRTETVRVLLLDTKYQLISVETIGLGSVNECIAHPREIFRPALIHSAFALAVVHNHPSGDPAPSEADRRLTHRLVQAAEVLGLRLLDHIIIGQPAPDRQPYTSFRELGLI